MKGKNQNSNYQQATATVATSSAVGGGVLIQSSNHKPVNPAYHTPGFLSVQNSFSQEQADWPQKTRMPSHSDRKPIVHQHFKTNQKTQPQENFKQANSVFYQNSTNLAEQQTLKTNALASELLNAQIKQKQETDKHQEKQNTQLNLSGITAYNNQISNGGIMQMPYSLSPKYKIAQYAPQRQIEFKMQDLNLDKNAKAQNNTNNQQYRGHQNKNSNNNNGIRSSAYQSGSNSVPAKTSLNLNSSKLSQSKLQPAPKNQLESYQTPIIELLRRKHLLNSSSFEPPQPGPRLQIQQLQPVNYNFDQAVVGSNQQPSASNNITISYPKFDASGYKNLDVCKPIALQQPVLSSNDHYKFVGYKETTLLIKQTPQTSQGELIEDVHKTPYRKNQAAGKNTTQASYSNPQTSMQQNELKNQQSDNNNLFNHSVTKSQQLNQSINAQEQQSKYHNAHRHLVAPNNNQIQKAIQQSEQQCDDRNETQNTERSRFMNDTSVHLNQQKVYENKVGSAKQNIGTRILQPVLDSQEVRPVNTAMNLTNQQVVVPKISPQQQQVTANQKNTLTFSPQQSFNIAPTQNKNPSEKQTGNGTNDKTRNQEHGSQSMRSSFNGSMNQASNRKRNLSGISNNNKTNTKIITNNHLNVQIQSPPQAKNTARQQEVQTKNQTPNQTDKKELRARLRSSTQDVGQPNQKSQQKQPAKFMTQQKMQMIEKATNRAMSNNKNGILDVQRQSQTSQINRNSSQMIMIAKPQLIAQCQNKNNSSNNQPERKFSQVPANINAQPQSQKTTLIASNSMNKDSLQTQQPGKSSQKPKVGNYPPPSASRANQSGSNQNVPQSMKTRHSVNINVPINKGSAEIVKQNHSVCQQADKQGICNQKRRSALDVRNNFEDSSRDANDEKFKALQNTTTTMPPLVNIQNPQAHQLSNGRSSPQKRGAYSAVQSSTCNHLNNNEPESTSNNNLQMPPLKGLHYLNNVNIQANQNNLLSQQKEESQKLSETETNLATGLAAELQLSSYLNSNQVKNQDQSPLKNANEKEPDSSVQQSELKQSLQNGVKFRDESEENEIQRSQFKLESCISRSSYDHQAEDQEFKSILKSQQLFTEQDQDKHVDRQQDKISTGFNEQKSKQLDKGYQQQLLTVGQQFQKAPQLSFFQANGNANLTMQSPKGGANGLFPPVGFGMTNADSIKDQYNNQLINKTQQYNFQMNSKTVNGFQRHEFTSTATREEKPTADSTTVDLDTENQTHLFNGDNQEEAGPKSKKYRLLQSLSPSNQGKQLPISYQPRVHAPCDTTFTDKEYEPNSKNFPYLSCQCYVVIDPHRNKVLFQKNSDIIREMASLTKIMTALVTVQLSQELKLNMKETWFKVSKLAADTCGTTAHLVEGQRVTIYELLHGLMLPSGNDAAMTLAENFSERLVKLKRDKPPTMILDRLTGQKILVQESSTGKTIKPFVKEMNNTAKKYYLKSSHFSNPHGLSDKSNHSSAFELAVLSNHLLKVPVLRKIVNTVSYNGMTYMPYEKIKKYCDNTYKIYQGKELPFTSEPDEQYSKYQTNWHNSNRLLTNSGFSGIKTGITQSAGSCLSIYYEADNRKLITVVLGARNIEYRWKDTRRLTLWAAQMLKDQKDNANSKVDFHVLKR